MPAPDSFFPCDALNILSVKHANRPEGQRLSALDQDDMLEFIDKIAPRKDAVRQFGLACDWGFGKGEVNPYPLVAGFLDGHTPDLDTRLVGMMDLLAAQGVPFPTGDALGQLAREVDWMVPETPLAMTLTRLALQEGLVPAPSLPMDRPRL
jgi:hypothetical protein